jgi:glutathione S-transferase
LQELDLPYERRPIQPRTGETKTPEFTALSARQKIPLLQDKGMVITESAAIVTYLPDVYGQPHNRLLPQDVRERARCLEWCFFVISELDATSLYVMRRHGDLRHIYREPNWAGSSWRNSRLKVSWLGRPFASLSRPRRNGSFARAYSAMSTAP